MLKTQHSRLAGWTSVALILLLLSFHLGFKLLSQFDYGYNILYGLLDIEQNIQTYGPQNQYKKQFASTSKKEHFRLFHAITVAINAHGQGLANIDYHDANGHKIDNLLRPAEVQHLQDVANLIDSLNQLSIILTCCLLLLLVLLAYGKQAPYALTTNLLFVLAFVFLLSIIILFIGPTEVFYAAHTWVFPDNHQWFFYYQESLMTTLMKAPDLFAYIAIGILIFGLLIFILLHKAILMIFTKMIVKQT